jgi:hypothetical protein
VGSHRGLFSTSRSISNNTPTSCPQLQKLGPAFEIVMAISRGEIRFYLQPSAMYILSVNLAASILVGPIQVYLQPTAFFLACAYYSLTRSKVTRPSEIDKIQHVKRASYSNSSTLLGSNTSQLFNITYTARTLSLIHCRHILLLLTDCLLNKRGSRPVGSTSISKW